MDCNRLKSLVKSWYLQVQDEALAPARMVEFIEKHIRSCQVCLRDPDVRLEVDRITEIVLPPSKVTKVVKKADELEEVEPEETEAAGAEEGDEDLDEGGFGEVVVAEEEGLEDEEEEEY
ncbi:MAG: hypothetical protein AB1634_10920 [Thermodesulfobacteriota bacterium]